MDQRDVVYVLHVVRNSRGFSWERLLSRHVISSIILATQLFALKTGLEFALDIWLISFIPGLIVESYCLKAVRLINQTEPSYVAQGILVAEIKKFLDCLN